MQCHACAIDSRAFKLNAFYFKKVVDMCVSHRHVEVPQLWWQAFLNIMGLLTLSFYKMTWPLLKIYMRHEAYRHEQKSYWCYIMGHSLHLTWTFGNSKIDHYALFQGKVSTVHFRGGSREGWGMGVQDSASL